MVVQKNNLLKGVEGRLMLFDVHYLPNEFQKSVIIYIHGFNGFKDWGHFDLIANYFAQHGYFFIKLNLSHNGTTIDQPEEFADLEAYSQNNYSKELADLEKMIDWVANGIHPFLKELNPHKIALLAHSRGGGIAIIKAAEDVRIKALITWAAVSECKTPWGNWSREKMEEWKEKGIVYIENKRTKQQMPLRYQLFEDYEINSKRFSIENAIKLLKIPFQACHGTQDEAVPFENLAKFTAWNNNCKAISIQSNHVFDRYHPFPESSIPPSCQQIIDKNIKFLVEHNF